MKTSNSEKDKQGEEKMWRRVNMENGKCGERPLWRRANMEKLI